MNTNFLINGVSDKIHQIFRLADDKIANLKKVVLPSISSIGSLFTDKIGLNTWTQVSLAVFGLMLFIASYKIASKNNSINRSNISFFKKEQKKSESKNIATNKSNMKYLDFPRTKEHEDAIEIIMNGVALQGGYCAILKKAPELYRAGDLIHYHEVDGKIKGVHTLRFLGYIFSKDDLRKNMKTLLDYKGLLKIVKTKFLERLSEVLDNLDAKNQIKPFLNDFVQEVTKDMKMSKESQDALVNKLKSCVQKQDKGRWEEFIKIILDQKIF